jgi:hypothetical protein
MSNDRDNMHDARYQDEESFLRHWSERVWDRAQLAHIAAIEEDLVTYAMTAWRPISISPPVDTLLLCASEEGIVLMTLNQLGDWRSSRGVPHKPPRAWMPCPTPPPLNGERRR